MRIDAGAAEQLMARYPGRVVARPLIEDVTATREPDPDWSFTDAAGHTHRWVAPDGEEVWWSGSVPTLERVVTGSYYCSDCRDSHERSEQRCIQCGEVVTPKYVSPVLRRQIVRWYELDPLEFQAPIDGDVVGVTPTDCGEFVHRATGDVFKVVSYEQRWPAARPAVVKCYPEPLFGEDQPPSKGARS